MPIPVAIGAGLIAGGTALAGSIGSWIQGRRQARKTRQANREMAKYAYSKDLEQWNRQNVYNRQMWDLQNVYNTPEAQMRRFEEAGLNKHLIYGRGDSGSAGSVPTAEMSKYQAPRQEYTTRPLEMANSIAQYQDFKMRSAQIDNVNAQTNTENQKTQLAILNKHLFAGRMYNNYRYKLEGGQWQKFKDSIANQLIQTQIGQTQASANQMQTNTALKAMELEWWKELKGIGALGKIAPFLMRILGR